MRTKRIGWVLALAAVSGCDPATAPVCTTSVEPGIRVAVVDSATGAPVRGFPLVIAREGAYVDTAFIGAYRGAPPEVRDTMRWPSLDAAHERAGLYSVEVLHPEYSAWRKDGVRVRSGQCHVRTVELTARLQKG